MNIINYPFQNYYFNITILLFIKERRFLFTISWYLQLNTEAMTIQRHLLLLILYINNCVTLNVNLSSLGINYTVLYVNNSCAREF